LQAELAQYLAAVAQVDIGLQYLESLLAEVHLPSQHSVLLCQLTTQ
jgi:hypothetical protein